MITPDECKTILESAIGEVEAVIPDDVLEASIHYIEEYKRLDLEDSFTRFPEAMEKVNQMSKGVQYCKDCINAKPKPQFKAIEVWYCGRHKRYITPYTFVFSANGNCPHYEEKGNEDISR